MIVPTQEQIAAAQRMGISLRLDDAPLALARLIELVETLQRRIEVLETRQRGGWLGR